MVLVLAGPVRYLGRLLLRDLGWQGLGEVVDWWRVLLDMLTELVDLLLKLATMLLVLLENFIGNGYQLHHLRQSLRPTDVKTNIGNLSKPLNLGLR